VWVETFEGGVKRDGTIEPPLLGFGFLFDDGADEPAVYFHVYWPWRRPRPRRVNLEFPSGRYHEQAFDWGARTP
jgi:hypothetical protein